MSNRELVIDVVSKLPEDTPIAEIIRELEFIAAVNEGIAAADRGEVLSLEEVETMIAKWSTESS